MKISKKNISGQISQASVFLKSPDRVIRFVNFFLNCEVQMNVFFVSVEKVFVVSGFRLNFLKIKLKERDNN